MRAPDVLLAHTTYPGSWAHTRSRTTVTPELIATPDSCQIVDPVVALIAVMPMPPVYRTPVSQEGEECMSEPRPRLHTTDPSVTLRAITRPETRGTKTSPCTTIGDAAYSSAPTFRVHATEPSVVLSA